MNGAVGQIGQASGKTVEQIMDTIDTGPNASIQFLFAKLQLAQSQMCKEQAMNYINEIKDIQTEQKAVADMIAKARALKNEIKGSGCSTMPQEMIDFYKNRGLKFDLTGGDTKHNKDEWDYNIKSLTNYQEQVGTKTQTLMVYVQDFMGQYNSFLQGANSAISEANRVTSSIATGR